MMNEIRTNKTVNSSAIHKKLSTNWNISFPPNLGSIRAQAVVNFEAMALSSNEIFLLMVMNFDAFSV